MRDSGTSPTLTETTYHKPRRFNTLTPGERGSSAINTDQRCTAWLIAFTLQHRAPASAIDKSQLVSCPRSQ